MRSLLTFAAFLPAALTMGIAACEKPETAPPVDVSAEAAAPPPAVAADARRGLDFAGTYSQVAADGKVTTLKLARDDT